MATSPICGNYVGTPNGCNVEAVETQASGAAFYEAHAQDQAPTPTAAVVALVLVLGLACVVMSIPSRRMGRRVTNRKGHQ